jgi:hypothetical protein
VLQLKNLTPFQAVLIPLADADGIDTVFAIVKATFVLGPRISLAEEQVPVTLVDKHHGEPATSSIRVPSDVHLGKRGTDVLLVGSAIAPGGRPTWQMDVSLRVGSLGKAVRVSGDRAWESGPSGSAVAWIAPFTSVPLVWERAFGGTDSTDKGAVADARNPVGKGFRGSDSVTPLHGLPLPNLEDPSTPITSPRDRPQPAAFAPIAPHWEPRRSYAGTYDDAWQKHRAPYLPRDFNSQFFQLAPTGLASSERLRGSEPIDLRGATPDGVLSFALPTARVRITFRRESGDESRDALLDTVLLDTDAARLIMVWSAALPCDKAVLKVREAEIRTEFVD